MLIMKKIEIEIPEGKEVQWVGDTLKLVDVKKPITERVKTFEDACKELGNNPYLKEYVLINCFANSYSKDLVAYLKLRIIVAALNEGWEPKFEKGEHRYYPWFYFYTKEEYDKLSKEKRKHCLQHSVNSDYIFLDIIYCNAYFDNSYSSADNSFRLAFKNIELAEYAAKQFADLYIDLYYKWQN